MPEYVFSNGCLSVFFCEYEKVSIISERIRVFYILEHSVVSICVDLSATGMFSSVLFMFSSVVL